MKNAQLWKRILNKGIAESECLPDRDGIIREIIRAPIIVGPDVDNSDLESSSYNWPKYSGLAMPFSGFWMERNFDGGSVGFLVTSKQIDNYTGVHFVCIKGGGSTAVKGSCSVQPYFSSSSSFNIESSGRLKLESDGTLLSPTVVSQRLLKMIGKDEAENLAFTQISLLLDVVWMLGAKNVTISPRRLNDPEATKTATDRNGGHLTGYRYHVLVVRPPGARADHPGEEIGSMPRHVCRGHFAEYGPDFGKGLLFGKYAGRFYVPPHLKGDKKNGVVEKDYEVRA